MKKYYYFMLALQIMSCNAYKDIPVHNLTVGMPVSEVQSIVKKPLVQVSMASDSEGNKKVYQVQKRIVRGGIARQQRFNLYFINDKLVKYEKDSEKFSF